jgi:hypothetical protein
MYIQHCVMYKQKADMCLCVNQTLSIVYRFFLIEGYAATWRVRTCMLLLPVSTASLVIVYKPHLVSH